MDGSGEICDRYAAKDARIRVTHTPNRGPWNATVCGVMQAQRDYIVSLDGDDRLDAALLETLDGYLADGALDALVYRLDYFGERSMPTYAPLYPLGRVLTAAEVLEPIIEKTDHSLCDIAIRTALFQTAMRGERQRLQALGRVIINDDYLLLVPAVCCIRTARAIPDVLYHYRLLNGSTSHKFNTNHVLGLSPTTAYVLDALREYDYTGEKWESLCYTAHLHMLAPRLDALAGSDLPYRQYRAVCKTVRGSAAYRAARPYEARGAFNRWERRTLRLFRHKLYGAMRLIERLKGLRDRLKARRAKE